MSDTIQLHQVEGVKVEERPGDSKHGNGIFKLRVSKADGPDATITLFGETEEIDVEEVEK